MKRTKICMRNLPYYSKGEETMNTVTHIVGGGLSCIMLVLCIVKPVLLSQLEDLLGAIIYGISLLCVYTISSIYHGLHPGTAKKVMQVLDHCMIYFLIAGTYTPILSAIMPKYHNIGCAMLVIEWGLGITAATLTAIDLKRYRVFSMVCYITMGWCLIFFMPQVMDALSMQCFLWILSGGIAYTVGAVIYGLGTKFKWMHTVFHLFVILGSVMQFIGIILYVL